MPSLKPSSSIPRHSRNHPTWTIPSLFLSVFKAQSDPFSRLKNPKIEKTEKVGEEDCYVISGPSSISKNETFWVSKEKYLIRKYSRSLEPPEEGRQMPEMTDEELEKTIKAMGQQVTDESKKNMREMMEQSQKVLKAGLKGSSTELHASVSSPELNTNDFNFSPPEGAVLKESLFGAMSSGMKGGANESMNPDKP